MKYWRGYLVAAIFAAVTWGMKWFAEGHRVLMDMIYPYVSRLILTTLAEWSAGVGFCVWQALLVGLIAAGVVTVVLMIVLRWNPIQWLGWVLAAVFGISMLNTLVYDLNVYAGPLADDIRLQVMDYTVSELNEAAVYYRDKANALAGEVHRDSDGYATNGSFADAAAQAADGFDKLAYEEAISVFAGTRVPVKEMGWGAGKGVSGRLIPLTGEALVNPDVPAAALPFAICKEMSHRMSIYSEADANFAAYMACINNSDTGFQYAGYLMAYKYCYEALQSVPTATAQACAESTDKGVNALLRKDLELCMDFYSAEKEAAEVNPVEEVDAGRGQSGESLVEFSEYSHVSDLLASWYVQTFILPLHVEEEAPFDPFDPTQVDLSGIVNAGSNG